MGLANRKEVMTKASEHQGHGICGARKRQGEGTCRRPAGWGTDHVGVGRCKLHGGSTRNQRTKARNDIIDAEVRAILQRETLTPIRDPLSQLQMLAAEVLAVKDVFAAKVESLTQWEYRNGEDTEELRAVIQGYERGLDRANRLLVGMARLDLDARLVKLTEAQAGLLKRVVEAVLDSSELGLSKDARSLGRTILARELTVVSSAA
jgi:hypothetical protein